MKRNTKLARVLAKAQRMYESSIYEDDMPLTHATMPETWKHRRARFLRLRDLESSRQKRRVKHNANT